MMLSNENVELLRHNRQLGDTVNALEGDLGLMEKKVRQLSSLQPIDVSVQPAQPEVESTIGPRVLALYEVVIVTINISLTIELLL